MVDERRKRIAVQRGRRTRQRGPTDLRRYWISGFHARGSGGTGMARHWRVKLLRART